VPGNVPRQSQWPSVNPGTFRHHVTFLEQSTFHGTSGAGIAYLPASPPHSAKCAIDPVGGSGRIQSGQDAAIQEIRITMRYQAWVLPSMRVQAADGDVFIIKTIENPRRMNRYLILQCVGIGANF